MFVFDAHCDSLSWQIEKNIPLNIACEGRQWDFAAIEGLNWVEVMAAFIAKENRDEIKFNDFLRLSKRLHWELAQNTQIKLIKNAADLAAVGAGQGVIFSLEGAEVLEGNCDNIYRLHEQDVRILGLAWNNDNNLAGGALGANRGLSARGKEAVRLVNKMPLVLDGAHLSEKSLAEVLGLSEKPIIVSHADSRLLCNHPRNLRDEYLREVAQAGGVVGVTFVREFLCADPAKANIVSVAEHIYHMVEVMGIEHVGIGSDFDGVERAVDGLEKAGHILRLSAYLRALGFNNDDIALIMGGNFRRVISSII